MGTTSTHLQNDFSGGQISYLYQGRIDAERYQQAVSQFTNYVPLLQGPYVRRPGTFFVHEILDSANPAVLIPFEFSNLASYVLEFGAGYIRFYTSNYQPILNEDLSIFQIPNPYAQYALTSITETQSADVLYLVHPDYPPQTLSRYGETTWTLDEFEFQDGPYLGINATNTELIPSAVSGDGITITANTSSSSQVIRSFSNSGGNIKVRVPGHGYFTGDRVIVSGVRQGQGGEDINDANGNWIITVIDLDNFKLNGSIFGGSYAGGNVTLEQITNCVDDGTGQIKVTYVAHGFVSGQQVLVLGVVGTVEANGQWFIEVSDADHFTLLRSIFVNPYISGGAAVLAIFEEGDIGRLIRLQPPASSQWGWVIIRSIVNSTTVIADVQSALANTNPTRVWRLGAWSYTTGFPSCVTFHEDRLVFGGNPSQPSRVDFSETSNYNVFSPTTLDAMPEITATSPISISVNTNKVNFVRWIFSDGKGLLVGTSDSSHLISPSTLNVALTAENARSAPIGDYGSAPIAAEKMGKSIVYVHERFQNIREMNYRFDAEDYIEPDLNVLAHNINFPGISKIVYQQIPHSILWCLRDDGALTSMTYERDSQVLRVGWALHFMGGKSANNVDFGIVESIASIASKTGTYDDVWMIVQRQIDGQTVRYIEVFSQFFDDYIDQNDAFFVDSGIVYSGGPTHTITGLDHLEGEMVSVLGDGATFPSIAVEGGQITLPGDPVSTAIVGLANTSICKTLRPNAPSTSGVSLGKKRHTHKIDLLVHRTSGLQIGSSLDNLFRVNDRSMLDLMDTAPPLLEGILDVTFQSTTDFDNFIYIVQSDPTPGCIMAIASRLEIMDGE